MWFRDACRGDDERGDVTAVLIPRQEHRCRTRPELGAGEYFRQEAGEPAIPVSYLLCRLGIGRVRAGVHVVTDVRRDEGELRGEVERVREPHVMACTLLANVRVVRRRVMANGVEA